MNKSHYLFLAIIIFFGIAFRFFEIQKIPPGLYIDEVSIGNNAYNVLKSGVDEHGESFPIFFKAFGEYKMPVYIYSVAGSMAIFGKNELAVRFPSAAAGVLTIAVFYLFLKKIIEVNQSIQSTQIKKYLPLLSTFLLCFSTWHIHFSRGGFEVNLGLFLYLTGSYLFLLFADKKKNLYLFGSVLLFVLTMYTYNTFRIITPLTWGFLALTVIKKIPSIRKQILISFLVFFVLSVPLLQFSLTSGGASRFAQTSAFSEYKTDTVMQKIMLYPMVYLKNYLSFFSFDFLFGYGDGNGRHQIAGFGLFYRWQFTFLIIGIGWIFRQKKSLLKNITIAILLLAPIPAALTRPSPHSLRILLMVLPLTIFISVGIISFMGYCKKWRRLIAIFIAIVAIYEFVIYLHFYYYHYPNVNALDWGAGYKKIVEKSIDRKNQYDHLVVDKNLGLTPIYFRFYDGSLKYSFVDTSWIKPVKWQGKRVLYIRPFYGVNNDKNIIDRAYLPGPNKDIYAEFWKL